MQNKYSRDCKKLKRSEKEMGRVEVFCKWKSLKKDKKCSLVYLKRSFHYQYIFLLLGHFDNVEKRFY